MVIGTSLTFFRGPEAHDRLLEDLRVRTGLPVSTMQSECGKSRGERPGPFLNAAGSDGRS